MLVTRTYCNRKSGFCKAEPEKSARQNGFLFGRFRLISGRGFDTIDYSREELDDMVWWQVLIIGVVALLAGGVAGFFISRKVFKNYLEKNPPVNENMIRAMMSQMGRTPSEKQVRQVMASMKQAK
jgi:hypothetical protein